MNAVKLTSDVKKKQQKKSSGNEIRPYGFSSGFIYEIVCRMKLFTVYKLAAIHLVFFTHTKQKEDNVCSVPWSCSIPWRDILKIVGHVQNPGGVS